MLITLRSRYRNKITALVLLPYELKCKCGYEPIRKDMHVHELRTSKRTTSSNCLLRPQSPNHTHIFIFLGR